MREEIREEVREEDTDIEPSKILYKAIEQQRIQRKQKRLKAFKDYIEY